MLTNNELTPNMAAILVELYEDRAWKGTILGIAKRSGVQIPDLDEFADVVATTTYKILVGKDGYADWEHEAQRRFATGVAKKIAFQEVTKIAKANRNLATVPLSEMDGRFEAPTPASMPAGRDRQKAALAVLSNQLRAIPGVEPERIGQLFTLVQRKAIQKQKLKASIAAAVLAVEDGKKPDLTEITPQLVTPAQWASARTKAGRNVSTIAAVTDGVLAHHHVASEHLTDWLIHHHQPIWCVPRFITAGLFDHVPPRTRPTHATNRLRRLTTLNTLTHAQVDYGCKIIADCIHDGSKGADNGTLIQLRPITADYRAVA